MESNRILGVSTAQWRQVHLQTQLQTTRLDAEGADRRCFGIEQSIFAAPLTPRIRLLSVSGPRLDLRAKSAGRNAENCRVRRYYLWILRKFLFAGKVSLFPQKLGAVVSRKSSLPLFTRLRYGHFYVPTALRPRLKISSLLMVF